MTTMERIEKCANCTVPWDKCNPEECLKDIIPFHENKKDKEEEKERGCLTTCANDPKCWVAGGMLDMSKCPLNQKKV
jgi:hypothetical protein